jgi:phosphoribosylformylglycinamidine synthase II
VRSGEWGTYSPLPIPHSHSPPDMITPEILDQHNITPDEYERIKQLMGREPNLTELGIFSVMWSEHCSYKSSKVHLRRLPTEGECLVQGPGENAGIVDIGDGWCAAFKIESHNHPSFIEPYQGAATGVGGILRDIFTMGARPVAAMNSLRFGPIRDEEVEDSREQASSRSVARNRRIMAGVVKGLGDYGNAFGVPTVGGEVSFAECYSLNPLVNAFALGLVRREHIFYGKAEGIGNAVIYVGAKTGRDGIHGATMASAEFDEAAMEKRPTVQVGDPFSEKLLLEACLEAMRAGAIVGIQDMGAAGLTSSSCEMGARAGTGLEIDLDLVPQREAGMTAYEMMLSESQERMLIVAKRGHDRQLMEIFHRWDLDAVVIGQVIAEQRLRVRHKGEVVADIPNKALTDEAPRYNRPQRPFAVSTEDVTPKIEAAVSNLKSQAGGESQVFTEILRRLVASPNLASKRWVYRQYDHMVRTNSVVLPGSDAAALRVKETRRSLAMSLDCNGRYCHLNPREGAKLAVAEAARNVVCSGARPLAITNCLNFASPERPEVMWAFSETIDGMAEACRALGTPVTGGNVSFYNETEGAGVYPTPVIGMLGLIEDARHTTTQWFKEAGDVILLLGVTRNDLGASELLSVVAGEASGAVPRLDLEAEKAAQKVCLEAIQAGLIRSAHDCSDGGLAVALAESCFSSYRRDAIGARIDLSEHAKLSSIDNVVTLLFAESPSRIILSVKPEDAAAVRAIADQSGVACSTIGETGGSNLGFAHSGKALFEIEVATLEEDWRNALPSHLDRPAQMAAD